MNRRSGAVRAGLRRAVSVARPPLGRVRRYLRHVRSGTAPAWFAVLAERWKSRNPVTLTDKIIHKMAWDRRPLLTTLSDKLEVRQWVADRIGEQYLIPLLAVVTDADEIEWDALPAEYACKATHASGGVIIVWNSAPPENRLPPVSSAVSWSRHFVAPAAADRDEQVALIRGWLRMRYWHFAGRRPEWGYRGVPRRIMFEAAIADERGMLPVEYKFNVLNGVTAWIDVIDNRARSVTRDVFDRDWNLVEGYFGNEFTVPTPVKPANFDELLRLAETLAEGIDYVRVDLYSSADRIYFGEMTSYSGGGDLTMPDEINRRWGELLTIRPGVLRR